LLKNYNYNHNVTISEERMTHRYQEKTLTYINKPGKVNIKTI